MYHTTGFTTTEITELCALVAPHIPKRRRTTGRKPALSFFRSVAVTLTYLRRHHVQHELAERFGTSQATISRTITAFVPALTVALTDWVPTVDDLDSNGQYIIDGSLLPCWSWRNRPDLYSGKHKRTGVTVQISCTLDGQLAWVSDPLPGSVHDTKALRESGFLDTTDNKPRHFGDRGYTGLNMITPHKKHAGRELADAEKQFNRQVNRIRYRVEQAIAHLKTWRILHTDYRRPYETFAETITAIIGLKFYRKSF
ncbi:transposase [Rathayibacter iranicus]|uniref:Transposase n=4 Tax=Rathayibacter iranicus TaxID=59737 RepID=A0AAD1AEB8_9MICO|nr:transposase [Rathayibacter iranicus]PPI56922.1 transposase [Rathayibacter iranicus]